MLAPPSTEGGSGFTHTTVLCGVGGVKAQAYVLYIIYYASLVSENMDCAEVDTK